MGWVTETKAGRPKGKGSKYKGRVSGKKDLGLAIQQAERKIKAAQSRALKGTIGSTYSRRAVKARIKQGVTAKMRGY